MAAVELTISGVLYDKYSRTTRPVVLIGEASLTDLGVGGGPMPPGPGEPPVIWGPGDPRPQPPIPVYPGGTPNPPVIWGPNDPRPSPPIYLPPDTPAPPDLSPDGEKPPPEGRAGWGYYDGRWGYFPGPSDAQPKAG